MSEAQRFMSWFRAERRERKLFDVKFYPADVADADTQAFFAEVNRALRLRAGLAFVPRPDLF